ncbi:XRE family transcriptional regulator [Lactococcus ileimucosae]|uniref:XRE family transcriptional regulator n=1 Tax=Lactococcus ileimucosae TaxID=2941329 RepID=UPI0035182E7F
MTKTKLQIMREKADMTIEQLAMNALMIQAVELNRYYNSLENFECSVANTVELLEKREINGMRNVENSNWIYIAQTLGCSVEDLVEE